MNSYAKLNLIGGALVVGSLVCGCDQPKPRCSAAPGDFAVRYEKISGNCEDLHGEVLSVKVYYSPRSKSDQSPDFNKAKIGIQPSAITAVLGHAASRSAAPNPEDSAFAIGGFATDTADDDDYCRVATLSTARVRVAALPEETTECGVLPAEPAVDIKYEFSDVRVYSTPGAYGTQLVANLTYVTPTCSGTYRAVGVYPAVPCNTDAPVPPDQVMNDAGVLDAALPPADDSDAAVAETDADCPAPEEEPGPQVPDETLCGEGSGISPEFAVACDAQMMMCVLANEPPSLK